MSIQVAIRHHTKYQYDRQIKLWPQTIRLRPAPHTRSKIISYALRVQPETHFINWQQDPFGNYLARLVFLEKTEELVIDVEVIVELVTINPFDFFLEEFAENLPFTYPDQLKKDLGPYLEIAESGPLLQAWVQKAQGWLSEKPRAVDFLVRLNQALCEAIQYTIRMQPGVQTCEQTLEKALGSCRDSGWLMVQLLRHLGLAARFVSGYLVQLKPDEKPLTGPEGPTEDFTDLHAWAEVYLPGAGWVGLDVTSGLFAGEGHIPLACTPAPGSAAPITGALEPCETTFSFSNVVERIEETPRVTRPYAPTQWTEMLALGEAVDVRMETGDMRLTMGGEPTFVSAMDMEGAEWNEAADGVDKRKMAWDLSRRLQAHFAPAGLIHQGQGKWYPGEPIPRWQYAIYWRKDGQALWEDPDLFADPNQTGQTSPEQSRAFARALAEALSLPPENAIPAYEDRFFFLWEQGNLPVDQSPDQIGEADSLARQTLAKLLKEGSDQPRGYVIPIRSDWQGGWNSSYWQFNRTQLFLIPGNSAMGLRLPLDRLPADSPASPAPDAAIAPTIRTALGVELRDGHLYVFLPPAETTEASLILLKAIERVASRLHQPLILEGYQLKFDDQIQKLVVAPDPGVIEVNIHPASRWKDIVAHYDVLFDMARESRLATEKFMLDGKHSGTGGGNHITLGGKSPMDSPFLRQPALLRSFVNFWQHHPGLSYLFSSNFIGPTSQAPRVDEGRAESLYELEIAFRELDRHPSPSPWLVDRLFRNLLIDVTGNTHRAEFCIDKLYSPDSATGRLGILEMRGFDMPPHKQMCLAQLLLIRCLTLAFWEKPYHKPLIRWGTELHDRFLIHHFVREDMAEVCAYLEAGGVPFKLEWLDPFFEFRFPVVGEVRMGQVEMILRSGIEPWNVLGEELGSTGTARFVDSSVERLEVKITGIQRERYKLLCNQTVVPLTETATRGTYVAAIRYKAWNPPSALHPTIEADVPLVFDLYDSWNERSVGGCTYHVSHPGGLSYGTFPVNSFEAESRRVNRFQEAAHSPRDISPLLSQSGGAGEISRFISTEYQTSTTLPVQEIEPDPEFPYTLDLRKINK